MLFLEQLLNSIQVYKPTIILWWSCLKQHSLLMSHIRWNLSFLLQKLHLHPHYYYWELLLKSWKQFTTLLSLVLSKWTNLDCNFPLFQRPVRLYQPYIACYNGIVWQGYSKNGRKYLLGGRLGIHGSGPHILVSMGVWMMVSLQFRLFQWMNIL